MSPKVCNQEIPSTSNRRNRAVSRLAGSSLSQGQTARVLHVFLFIKQSPRVCPCNVIECTFQLRECVSGVLKLVKSSPECIQEYGRTNSCGYRGLHLYPSTLCGIYLSKSYNTDGLTYSAFSGFDSQQYRNNRRRCKILLQGDPICTWIQNIKSAVAVVAFSIEQNYDIHSIINIASSGISHSILRWIWDILSYPNHSGVHYIVSELAFNLREILMKDH